MLTRLGNPGERASVTWERQLLALFDDLEQQAEGLALAERDVAVEELSRAGYAEVDLAARLHASIGARLVLAVVGVGQIRATVHRVGTDWLLGSEETHEWIVRLAALGHVRGLADRAVDERHRPAPARVGLGSALRKVAEDRVAVVLHRLEGGSVRGQVRRVGADFVELWVSEHAESWTSGEDGHVEVVPFAWVAALRRA
jgi:hypothetical protein